MRRAITLLVLFAIAGLYTSCASDEPPDTLISPLPVSSTDFSPSPSPSPRNNGKVVTITIAGERIDVSESRVEVSLNQQLRIEVTSDRSEQLHVHGYEKKTEIKAGEQAVLEFAADIPGVFEVELEKTHRNLFELRVS